MDPNTPRNQLSLSPKADLSNTAAMCSPPPSKTQIDTLRRYYYMPSKSSIKTISIDIYFYIRGLRGMEKAETGVVGRVDNVF